MNNLIHPSSVIDPQAKIAENVQIGPFCVVGPDVTLGQGCHLRSHVVIEGRVEVGENNIFYPGAVIGSAPQDLGYKDEPTNVKIGNSNIFRENTTVHKGTTKQDLITIIGSECLVMVGAHIGHDCYIGDKVVLVNNVLLAGHVEIGEGTVLGGNSAVQQFGKIGKGCFIGGGSSIDKDIPSFSSGYGNRVEWRGLNLIGLKRRGFSREDISGARKFFEALKKHHGTYANLFSSESFMSDYLGNPITEQIIEDILKTKNGIAVIRQ